MLSSLRQNGIVLMLMAAFFFSMMGLLVKTMQHEIPFFQSMFFRFLINCLLLLPFLLKDPKKFKIHKPGLMLIRCVCGFVAGAMYFYSYVNIPLANAFVLQYSSPIFVVVFAVFFLKESVRYLQVFLICLAFAGAAFMVQPEWGVIDFAHGICLLSAIFAGLAYTSVKKLIGSHSFVTIVFYFSLFSSIMTLILFGRDFVSLHIQSVVPLLAIGVVATCGQLCLTYAYKHQPASVVAPFVYSAFLYGLVYDFVFWEKWPGLTTWIGAALIIGSGIVLAKIKKPITT